MAKIVYGVSGEGSGHSSRAREVIDHLEAEGHDVWVVSYDRGAKDLGSRDESWREVRVRRRRRAHETCVLEKVSASLRMFSSQQNRMIRIFLIEATSKHPQR